MLLTANHTIRRRVDGQRQTIDANQVFEATAAEGQAYLAEDAARKPTETEIALFNLGRPKAAEQAPEKVSEPTPVVEQTKAYMKLAPKKQGDAYVAVDEADNVVSGDQTFSTKSDCAAWIKANPIEADPNAGLLD